MNVTAESTKLTIFHSRKITCYFSFILKIIVLFFKNKKKHIEIYK